jgi:hypothetical protein
MRYPPFRVVHEALTLLKLMLESPVEVTGDFKALQKAEGAIKETFLGCQGYDPEATSLQPNRCDSLDLGTKLCCNFSANTRVLSIRILLWCAHLLAALTELQPSPGGPVYISFRIDHAPANHRPYVHVAGGICDSNKEFTYNLQIVRLFRQSYDEILFALSYSEVAEVRLLSCSILRSFLCLLEAAGYVRT